MDCSLPASSVCGMSQARILELVAISFSGNLPNLGIEPMSPALTDEFFTTEPPGKPKEGIAAEEEAEVNSVVDYEMSLFHSLKDAGKDWNFLSIPSDCETGFLLTQLCRVWGTWNPLRCSDNVFSFPFGENFPF